MSAATDLMAIKKEEAAVPSSSASEDEDRSSSDGGESSNGRSTSSTSTASAIEEEEDRSSSPPAFLKVKDSKALVVRNPYAATPGCKRKRRPSEDGGGEDDLAKRCRALHGAGLPRQEEALRQAAEHLQGLLRRLQEQEKQLALRQAGARPIVQQLQRQQQQQQQQQQQEPQMGAVNDGSLGLRDLVNILQRRGQRVQLFLHDLSRSDSVSDARLCQYFSRFCSEQGGSVKVDRRVCQGRKVLLELPNPWDTLKAVGNHCVDGEYFSASLSLPPRLRDRHFNEHTVRLLDVPDALAFEGGDRLRAALASAFGDVSYTFTPFPFSGAVYCSFQRHQTKLLAVSKEWLEVDGGHIGVADFSTKTSRAYGGGAGGASRYYNGNHDMKNPFEGRQFSWRRG